MCRGLVGNVELNCNNKIGSIDRFWKFLKKMTIKIVRRQLFFH